MDDKTEPRFDTDNANKTSRIHNEQYIAALDLLWVCRRGLAKRTNFWIMPQSSLMVLTKPVLESQLADVESPDNFESTISESRY
jgi:hypothetical protein